MKYQLKLADDEYIIIYLRKSRADNESESVEEVLARHERQLQSFAVSILGKKIEEEFIFREVVSGETIEDRPQIKKVLEIIKDKKCRGVLIIEPQRLTRGDLIDLGNIIYAFQYSKTLILTPTKTYNLDDKYDREFFERELLRGKEFVEYTKEILARGRTASACEGNFISSVPPFGYDRMKNGKSWVLVPNPIEAEYVRLIFDLYINEGLGANLIAQRLDALGAKPRKAKRFTSTAIRQILENETYTGKIRWRAKPIVKEFIDGKVVKKRIRNKNYQIFEGKHEAIIDEETFKKSQERKGKNSKERIDYELKNIYSGLVKCKKCGAAISQRIYRRNGQVTRADRYYCRSGVYCDNKSANADVVKEAILRTLKAYLKNFEVEIDSDNKSQIEMYDNMIRNLEAQLEDISQRQKNAFDAFERNIYTDKMFLERNGELEKERDEVVEKIKNASSLKPSIEETQRKYYSLHEAIQSIENPYISAKQKNILLKNIIEVIYYEKNESSPSTGETLENSNIVIELILK